MTSGEAAEALGCSYQQLEVRFHAGVQGLELFGLGGVFRVYG